MWWIQTTGYHLGGLIWLIVIAAIFVIAAVALSTAGAAAGNARRTRRMMRDHEAYHLATGTGAGRPADSGVMENAPVIPPAVVPPASLAPEERVSSSAETESRPADSSLGDSMRILHERYARGEITREEYLRAREDMMAMTR
jgi:uncharacterized membrane protein